MIVNNAAAGLAAAREDARRPRSGRRRGPTPGEIERAKWFSVNTIMAELRKSIAEPVPIYHGSA